MDKLLKIFNLSLSAENISIDEIFMHLFESWNERKGSIVKYMIEVHGMFKGKSEDDMLIRQVLITYIKTLLLDSSLVVQKRAIVDMGPIVLVDMILDTLHVDYDNILKVVEEISMDDSVCEDVFVPIIYFISYLASDKNITKDFMKYLYAMETLINLDGIKKLFAKKYLWGLEKHSLKYVCHYGYTHDQSPCFLDGFLEVFIYPKSNMNDKVQIFYNKESVEIGAAMLDSYNNLNTLKKFLYGIILSLIVKNEKNKENFVRFVTKVYDENRDRKKISFDYTKVISDGYAYNLCSVLGEFCKKIVNKELDNLIDSEFIRFIDMNELYKDPGISKSFVTTMFFMKVEFLRFFYGSIIENARIYEHEYDEIQTMYDIRRDERYKEMLKILESRRATISFFLSPRSPLVQESNFLDFAINRVYLKYLKKYKDEHFDIILELKYITVEYMNKKVQENYLKFVEKLLNSEDHNVHIKKKALMVISTDRYFLNSSLFSSLIKYYNSINKSETDFYERYAIRQFVVDIFQKDKNENIKNMELSKQNIKFINFVIGDLEYLLSSGLNAIMNIKRIMKEIEEEKDKENIEKLKKELSSQKRIASGSMGVIKKVLNLVCILVQKSKKIFLTPEILNKFINILNY
ncbi:Ubiquitin fusion degradation protein 2, partial [Spraguea lophii 42_110]